MLPQRFTFRIRSLARHPDRLAENHLTAREGQGDLKAVPALGLDLPGGVPRGGDDWEAGDLRQRHDAFLYHVARSARSIRRDGQIIAALRPAGEFQQGLRAAPAGGAAHRMHAETLEDAGQETAVFAGAHHRGHARGLIVLLRVAVILDEAERQPVVPDAINRRAGGTIVEIPGDIGPSVTQGRRNTPDQQMDQPRAQPLVPSRRMGHHDSG